MPKRPPFITQEDETRCQYDNCGIASHCMAIWRHLEGLNPKKVDNAPWPPTPKFMRNVFSPTTCGGTSLNDNFFLAQEYYGAQLEFRYDVPWADFKTVVASGRGAVVRIDYSPLHGTAYDHSPRFNGSHQVYVNAYRASDGRFDVADPLANGFAWWPGWLLKEAAGIATSQAGLVDASFTRDTEGIMIRITSDTPKLISTPAGKYLHFTDGTRFKTLENGFKDRLSPYGTTIDGVDYRVVRATSNDIKYVFLVRNLDTTLKPVVIS